MHYSDVYILNLIKNKHFFTNKTNMLFLLS